MRVMLCGPASPMELLKNRSGPPSLLRGVVGLGGSPVNMLAEGLLNAGHQVKVITLAREVHGMEAYDSDDLSIRVGHYRDRARARAFDGFRQERHQLRAMMSGSQFDVVHAHWTYEFAQAALASFHYDRVLVTAHDAPLTILRHLPDPYRLLRAGMAFKVRAGTVNLTAVSHYLAERLRRELFFFGPISVVPNIAPRLPSGGVLLAAKSAGPVIVDVADSSSRKNVKILIRAIHLLSHGRPGIRLKLIGPGLESGGEIEQWATLRGVAEHVDFLGELGRAEVGETLAACDVFVHPSLEETFGMSVVEAMMLSKPVVVGERSGGVAETVGRGLGGDLCDVTDPGAIARAIDLLLSDELRRKERGSAASAFASDNFGMSSVTAKYVHIYEKMLVGALR